MFESNFAAVKALYYANILATVAYLILFGPTLFGILLTALIFFLMNPIGIVIGYHRYWTHRSFEFRSPIIKWFITTLASVSGVGSAIGWVGIHNEHHKHSDSDGDPHAAARGFFGMMTMRGYCSDISPRSVAPLLRSKPLRRMHEYYFLFPAAYAAGCFALGGIDLLIAGFCAPAAMSLAAQNLTNYVNHFGGKPRNVAWINVFNFGDGWHANHHDDPSNFTTSHSRRQFDPAGWLIKKALVNG